MNKHAPTTRRRDGPKALERNMVRVLVLLLMILHQTPLQKKKFTNNGAVVPSLSTQAVGQVPQTPLEIPKDFLSVNGAIQSLLATNELEIRWRRHVN